MRQLFLGGVRSGKSQLAEAAAAATGCAVTYIATAQLLDREMCTRAEKHKARRPQNWQLVEEPLALAGVLQKNAAPDRCLLVDCLTLWLSNLLAENDTMAEFEIEKLLNLLPALSGEIICVSSEIGLGVMPDNALARRYADRLGELNQAIARRCERVVLAVAGLPQILKQVDEKNDRLAE